MPSFPERPRATVVGAFLEGWRRAIAAPVVTVSIFVATLLFTLPLAFALRGMLETHLGQSMVADRAQWNWDEGWAAEFASQAQGLGRTFTHEMLGFGGTMSIMSGLLDARPLAPAVAGAVVAYVAFWVFLSGGILDRFARARPVRTHAFFAACGVYFVRFLRLALFIAPIYWVLFRWLHPLLFTTIYDRLTRDMTSEQQAVLLRSGLYLIFLAALMIVSLTADFAKVRAVVEDRRSMLAALGASLRFIRRRPLRAAALYLLNVLALLVISRLWLQIAPPGWGPTWRALLLTQLFVVARLGARLAFVASEVAFFQGELAHAQYTATPDPIWPESPSAESVARGR